MKKRQGGSGGAKPPQENFVRFDKVILTFFTKFGGLNEGNFDNDDFGIVRKNTGGLGGGAPQKIFSILGAKILLKNQKKS